MGYLRTIIVAGLVMLVAAMPVSAGEKRVVGYLLGSRGRYAVADVPADRLTHLNYAFAVIMDGVCVVNDAEAARERFAALRVLKEKHPQLKTLVSVGGWSDSPPFSDMAMTREGRERFARSCAAFAAEHGFDGVDIDWEYPGGGGVDPKVGRPEDTVNFTLLLRELRSQLDAQGNADGKRYLLTIAAPAGEKARSNMQLDQIHPLLDFVNLMTYDYAGPWEPRTGHNAPLYSSRAAGADAAGPSADEAVSAYLAAGMPAEKLVLGVPFYGRAFGNVSDTNQGLFQPHSGRVKNGGESTYRALAARDVGKSPNRHWDDGAKSPWLYDPETRVMTTYDDPESIRIKARYARDKGLGGVMFWELSQDDAQSSLLGAIHAGLNDGP